MLHLAVDVGGTFTDICLFDDQEGATRVAKVSSTRDPIDAVFDGIGEMDIALGEISLFSHGTTVATNALITRGFPRAAMVTTRGFRDVIEIRRGTKQDLWDAYEDVAPPYIRRRDRFEVTERVDYAGEQLEPVNEDDVRHVAHLIERRGIETVAVCLVNAHVNPEHENKVKEILQVELWRSRPRARSSRRSSSTSASRRRSQTPCSPRSSAITQEPSPSACEKAGTKATCSSCTRAVAS